MPAVSFFVIWERRIPVPKLECTRRGGAAYHGARGDEE